MDTNKAIMKVRKAKGYTQAQIAGVLQTTQQQYSKYEQGIQEIPVRHIKTLCEFYGITANKLIGIETYMSQEESATKFEKLCKETIDMITWAYDQEHISKYATDTLISNFESIAAKIAND